MLLLSIKKNNNKMPDLKRKENGNIVVVVITIKPRIKASINYFLPSFDTATI